MFECHKYSPSDHSAYCVDASECMYDQEEIMRCQCVISLEELPEEEIN